MDLILVSHTFLGEQWTQGATPPSTPTVSLPDVPPGTRLHPVWGQLFHLCRYFFFTASCSNLPYSQDKTKLGQTHILFTFSIWSGL